MLKMVAGEEQPSPYVSVLHIHVSVLRLGERERGGVRKGEGEVFMLGNERAYSGRGSAGEAKSSTH